MNKSECFICLEIHEKNYEELLASALEQAILAIETNGRYGLPDSLSSWKDILAEYKKENP